MEEIQPNLVCQLLTSIRRATEENKIAPPPGALMRGQNVKYHLFSITWSMAKILYQNVCVCVFLQ